MLQTNVVPPEPKYLFVIPSNPIYMKYAKDKTLGIYLVYYLIQYNDIINLTTSNLLIPSTALGNN